MRPFGAGTRRALVLALIATLAGCASGYQQGAIPISEEGSGNDVRWLKAEAKGLGTLDVAMVKPEGFGPFPTVVILHGDHGFAREYLEIARAFARQGLVAVTGCWFKGQGGADTRFITPIECPDAPPSSALTNENVSVVVDALIEAARQQREVRKDRIAVFGHSRGGEAALLYLLKGGAMQALVLNSAGYPDEVIGQASRINVPVLVLHGTADTPADGGSPMSDIQRARRFVDAMNQAQRTVEAVYYKGGRHNAFFAGPNQYKDEMQRVTNFFHQHLLQ